MSATAHYYRPLGPLASPSLKSNLATSTSWSRRCSSRRSSSTARPSSARPDRDEPRRAVRRVLDQHRPAGRVARTKVLRKACAKSSAGPAECPATSYPFVNSARTPFAHFHVYRSQSRVPACTGPLPIRARCSAHGVFRHSCCRSWDQPFACRPGYSRAPSAARHESCGDSARPSDDLRACHPPVSSTR